MRPILHIGYPKTASTWFQKSFYPFLTNVHFEERKGIQNMILIPGGFDWDEAKCKKYFENRKQRILICEELLLGRLRPGGAKHFITKEIAGRLKKLFPDASVVIFLRNQIDALASAYTQYLKSGGNFSVSRFLYPEKIWDGEFTRLVLMGPDYFRYVDVLDYYTKLFGKQNIHIFLYEDFKESPQDFVQNFASELDLEYDKNLINYNPLNEGFRRGLIPVARFCNFFTRKGVLNKQYIFHVPYMHRLNRFIFEQANKFKIFGAKPSPDKLLGKKNVQKLRDHFKKSNRILIDKYGLSDIEKFNYPL